MFCTRFVVKLVIFHVVCAAFVGHSYANCCVGELYIRAGVSYFDECFAGEASNRLLLLPLTSKLVEGF